MDDDQDGLLSRRTVIQTGAVGFAGLMLLDASAYAAPRPAAAPIGRPRYPTSGYARSRFTPHVGTAVDLVPAGGAPVRMLLAGVDDVANIKALTKAEDAYTLRFSGPVSQGLAEGVVGVRHPKFGKLDLHVIPGQAVGTQQVYVAAVNRRIPRRGLTRR